MATQSTPHNQNSERGKRRMQGIVVRKSGDKTVAVEVKQTIRHPLYHRIARRTKRYLVHDPDNTAQVGQTVTIVDHRPLSARKRWILWRDNEQS